VTDQIPGAASHTDPTPATRPPSSTAGGGTPAGLALAWRAPLVAYGVTLAASLVLGVLLLIAIASGSTPDEVDDVSSAADGVLAWIAVPVQLAAMALGGRLGLGVDDFSVSVYALPLLLTATYLAVLGRSAAGAEARTPSGSRQGRLLTSGAAAVVAAVVVAVVTRLLALRSDDTVIHALSVSLVAGTLVLTFFGDFIARELRAAGAPDVARRWAPAAFAWLSHVGLWLAVSLPVLFVVTWIREGFQLALTVPLWGPTGGLWTYALGHLSAIGTLGTYTYAWSDGGILTPLALLLGAVVATVGSSVVWHLRGRRTAAELASPASWAHLPAAFAAGGLLVTLVSVVSIGGGAFGVSGSLAVMPALWTCLVLAIWALGAEWLSRNVAPRLAAALPPRVVERLRGPEQTDVPVESRPAPAPLTPEQARRVRRIALIGGGVAAVAVIGAIAVSVISSTYFTPERAAQDHVDAVASGDLEAVAATVSGDDEVSDALLTTEVLDGAADRPTEYTVGEITTLGGNALAEVTAEDGVGGESYVSLEKGDKKFGLFQEWVVVEGLTSTLNISTDGASDMSVNGVAVGAPEEGYGSYVVLPGTYTVDPFAGNEWLEGAPSEVEVPLGGFASPDIASPQPSEAFTRTVDESIGAWLDECMASTEIDPDGCPQSSYAYGDVRDLTWELSESPTVDYDFFSPSFPMSLYVTGGSATATYEVDESYGFGPAEWTEETEESSLDFSVEVDLVGDRLEVTPETY
jgi:hypothetical protein